MARIRMHPSQDTTTSLWARKQQVCPTTTVSLLFPQGRARMYSKIFCARSDFFSDRAQKIFEYIRALPCGNKRETVVVGHTCCFRAHKEVVVSCDGCIRMRAMLVGNRAYACGIAE